MTARDSRRLGRAGRRFDMRMPIILIVIAFTIPCANGQGNSNAGIPESVTTLFKASGQARLYDFSSHLKPSIQRGDFDGDGKPDTAFLIKRKNGGKIGIALYHSFTNTILIVGAGNELGNGGDNFDWMDLWSTVPKATVVKKIGRALAASVKGDAFHVEKSESASGLIFWNGRRYVWRQAGD